METVKDPQDPGEDKSPCPHAHLPCPNSAPPPTQPPLLPPPLTAVGPISRYHSAVAPGGDLWYLRFILLRCFNVPLPKAEAQVLLHW